MSSRKTTRAHRIDSDSDIPGEVDSLVDISLIDEMLHMSPEETVTALTLNAAAAIDRAATIGSLDVGKQGDAVILEFPSYQYLPYHTGVNCVETVIKKGNVVFETMKGVSRPC